MSVKDANRQPRSTGAVKSGGKLLRLPPPRHCEARSAVAFPVGAKRPYGRTGLPRAFGPRNDGVEKIVAVFCSSH
jgi:hypothetical protein